MKQALAAFFTLALLILADAATLAGATIPCPTYSCGFLYGGGTWTLIESIEGNLPVVVNDINNAGQIVGHFIVKQGFVYGAGKLTLIDVPGSLRSSTQPLRINDAGQVIGTFRDRETHNFRGFFYDDGLFTTIHMPGALSTFATGLNDSGQIVGIFDASPGGFSSFLYTAGTYTMILPGRQVFASDINNSGQIAGRYVDSRENQGFLYDAGTFTTIDPPGQVDTFAPFGINNSGQIVSWYESFGKQHGYLYDHGTYTRIDFPGALSATLPYGINDSGQIVGTVRFFPEPASVILLAGGLGVILFLRLQVLRRRASNTGRGEQR